MMNKVEKLEDEVYTTKEIAFILKVSTASIYDAIDQKRLRAFRVGEGLGAYRITKKALLTFIEGQENEEEDR